MRPEIYFSISPADTDNRSGLADILAGWHFYYHIGKSMGWTYIHQPLRANRSDSSSDIFDFLGFNRVLMEHYPAGDKAHHVRVIHSFGHLAPLPRWRTIRKRMMWMFRWHLYMSRLQPLLPQIFKGRQQKHTARDIVLIQLYPQGRKKHMTTWVTCILQRLILGTRRRLAKYKVSQNWVAKYDTFTAASTATSSARLIPLLRRAYKEARMADQYPSKFEAGKIKVLVHIRQGDVGVVRIPSSGKFIVALGGRRTARSNNADADWIVDSLGDLAEQWPKVAPEEYLPILKQLLERFHPDDFSIVTSSDGYRKTFEKIYKQQEKDPVLSDDQLNELNRIADTYEEKEFKPFSNISDTVIGENSDNLRHLVDACMRADIVIGSIRGALPAWLLYIYRRLEKTPPLLIFLYRNNTYPANLLTHVSRRKPYANTVYADVENPDFDHIEARIRAHLEAGSLMDSKASAG